MHASRTAVRLRGAVLLDRDGNRDGNRAGLDWSGGFERTSSMWLERRVATVFVWALNLVELPGVIIAVCVDLCSESMGDGLWGLGNGVVVRGKWHYVGFSWDLMDGVMGWDALVGSTREEWDTGTMAVYVPVSLFAWAL